MNIHNTYRPLCSAEMMCA